MQSLSPSRIRTLCFPGLAEAPSISHVLFAYTGRAVERVPGTWIRHDIHGLKEGRRWGERGSKLTNNLWITM